MRIFSEKGSFKTSPELQQQRQLQHYNNTTDTINKLQFTIHNTHPILPEKLNVPTGMQALSASNLCMRPLLNRAAQYSVFLL